MRLVIVGASGRMGLAITRAAQQWPQAQIVAAVDHPSAPAVGQDIGQLAGLEPLGIQVTTDLKAALEKSDVMIDFSSPRATAVNLAACAEQGVAALVGTTGLSLDAERAADLAAKRVPILLAANTSLGVTLLAELVRAAAHALPAEFEIEIHEAHHRDKKDSPSGTALALGRAAAQGRETIFEKVAVSSRVDQKVRGSDEIGFSVVRGGDVVGDHSVMFLGAGERVVLSHQATDRAIFARGALQGAQWLQGKPAGRYAMSEVIGFKPIN